MEATAAVKEEFVDPVCGMTVDPARAAGTSERDGVRYYFCSPGCKATFDAGAPAADAQSQESCCGGSGAAMPVQLTPARRAAGAGEVHPPEHHADAHAHHAVTPPRADGRGAAHDAGVDAEEAQAESYRTMMRKFW